MSDRITSDIGPFAIVPEWILRSGVSDRAVRLFAVLARYADRNSEAFPARSTLAHDLRTSRDSIDRACKELAAINAVRIEHRKDSSGDQTSNLFRLAYVNPQAIAGVAAAMRLPSRTHATTGGRSDAATVAAPVRHRTIPTVTRERSSEEDLSCERWFDEVFWPAYPRKVGRKAAKRSLLKVKPNEAVRSQMLSALKRQQAGWSEPRFIPHASTWLHGERWLDEEQVTNRRESMRMPAQALGGPAVPDAEATRRMLREQLEA